MSLVRLAPELQEHLLGRNVRAVLTTRDRLALRTVASGAAADAFDALSRVVAGFRASEAAVAAARTSQAVSRIVSGHRNSQITNAKPRRGAA